MGWEHGDIVTLAEVPVTPQCPVHPVLTLVPCHRAGGQHIPLPQHGQPQKHHATWCSMRHSPAALALPQTLVSRPNWDRGGGCCHSISSNHLDGRAWSPALASRGGLQHSLSPAGTVQRDKVWGRAATRTSPYLGLSQPVAGDIGTKRLCTGAGDIAETKNPAKTGRGVQLHPDSIPPSHAGGPGQSSPSPSPLHPDPTAKG